MTTRTPLPSQSVQRIIGLTLAALVGGGWLSVHFYSMFVFELTWDNWPFAMALAVLQIWLSVGTFIICHDAMHGTLAPGWPRVNAAVGAPLLMLYAGFRWTRMRDAHFTHHKLSGHKGDPDFDEEHPGDFLAWYWTFFKRYFGWFSLIFVHTVVGIYLFVFEISFMQIFVLYGAPALLSSLQLFYFGTFRPHHQAADKPFSDQHNARTNDFHPLISLATCFHFGYHLEHHRAPHVPWWALPGAKRAGVGETSDAAGSDLALTGSERKGAAA